MPKRLVHTSHSLTVLPTSKPAVGKFLGLAQDAKHFEMINWFAGLGLFSLEQLSIWLRLSKSLNTRNRQNATFNAMFIS